MDFSDKRLSYEKGQLRKKEVPDSPIELMEQWLQTAIDEQVQEPYAMSLATCGQDKMPSVRIVLMRELNDKGVIFYTNYDSSKGQDISENPYAEVLFFWHELERQVRIRGVIQKIDAKQSTDYFHKRPHDSQVAAWVSEPQSGLVKNRATIDERFSELKQQYPEGSTVPRPIFWGGYQIIAHEVEFWQGRANRIHDRLLYKRNSNYREDTSWQISRLLP